MSSGYLLFRFRITSRRSIDFPVGLSGYAHGSRLLNCGAHGRGLAIRFAVGITAEVQTYDDVREIMRLWVERFVACLDIIHVGRAGE